MYNLNTMQRAIALSGAALALTASPVLARPADYPATHVTQSPAGAASSSGDLRSPDAIDAAAGGPSLDLRSPDAIDAGATQAPVTSSLAGSTSASSKATDAVATTKADDGLDWAAIGIGAGGIAAVSLIGLTGVAVTHRGRMRTAR
jgi:hypothetical protein